VKAKAKGYDYSELLGLIKSKKLRQEDLALKIGMNPATLNLKLNNKSEFNQSQIRQICIVLDIPSRLVPKYFFCEQTLENAS
jgi:transcriptional regulator with XRE-family HTH domain